MEIVIGMNSFSVGDVVEATRTGTLWEFAEILQVTEREIIICNTDLYPERPYSVSRSSIRRSCENFCLPDTRRSGFPAPVANFQRIGNLLSSTLLQDSSPEQLTFLLCAYGATIEHLLNVGLRCDKRDPFILSTVIDYFRIVVRVTVFYFRKSGFEVAILRLVLKLLSKALDKGSAFSDGSNTICPVFEEFLQLDGVALCLDTLHKIHQMSAHDSRYLNAIRLIPLFKTHRQLPREVYVQFVSEVLERYQNPGVLQSADAKHYIAFIEAVDTCLSNYGLKHYFSQQQQYALKRTQISLCVQLILSNIGHFDSIEYFSALMKAHCRDAKFQQILQEFSFSVDKIQEASRRLPEFMREYFFKICCMGNFSVAEIVRVIDSSEAGLQKFLSAEFFEDLLRYKGTDFLLFLPPNSVQFCINHFCSESNKEKEMKGKLITSGADFRVLERFCLDLKFDLESCILLANSSYSTTEKDKLLHRYFKTYSDLIAMLEVNDEKNCKEKAKLLAIYYNTILSQSMFVRKYSLWRQVPISLFVQAFRDFY